MAGEGTGQGAWARTLYLSIDDLPPVDADRHGDAFDGIANRVLWPILHGMPARAWLLGNDFDGWRAASEAFARTALPRCEDATIWVHDYQLSLLPACLRDLSPDGRIGWFCHVPWPGCDTLAVLPYRAQILEGILGASYVGFHTAHYRDNFLACVRELTVYDVDLDACAIDADGRTVRAGVHPVGVPFDTFDRCGADPGAREAAAKLRREIGSDKLVVAVDRLDYTKGIVERLRAFEAVLAARPDLRGRVSLVQVGVPTRHSVPGYADLRREIESTIGAINGEHASGAWVPVRYFSRALSGAELVALYLAADVMAVTPLRDGMNLVAQEFVATRNDERGVLLLSELAGAATYLRGALLVNPWWIERTALGLLAALEMPPGEQRARMVRLRREVRAIDITRWIPSFVQELER